MDQLANEKAITMKEQLFDAAKTGNVETLKMISAELPKLMSERDDKGFTPLIVAAYYDQLEAVKFLVEQGADVNAQDSGGNTALMGVAFKNYIDVAHYLIDSGADINIKNPKGMKAVDFAIQFGNVDMAKLLESKGR